MTVRVDFEKGLFVARVVDHNEVWAPPQQVWSFKTASELGAFVTDLFAHPRTTESVDAATAKSFSLKHGTIGLMAGELYDPAFAYPAGSTVSPDGAAYDPKFNYKPGTLVYPPKVKPAVAHKADTNLPPVLPPHPAAVAGPAPAPVHPVFVPA